MKKISLQIFARVGARGEWLDKLHVYDWSVELDPAFILAEAGLSSIKYLFKEQRSKKLLDKDGISSRLSRLILILFFEFFLLI